MFVITYSSLPASGQLPTTPYSAEDSHTWATLWTFGLDNGDMYWTANSSFQRRTTVYEGNQPIGQGGYAYVSPCATGQENVVYARFDNRVTAYNAQNGNELWTSDIGAEDVLSGIGYPGLAYDDPFLYVASASTIYKLKSTDQTEEWQRSLPPGPIERPTDSAVVRAGPNLFVPVNVYASTASGVGSAVHSLDVNTGAHLWRLELSNDQSGYTSVGESVLAWIPHGARGNITIVGRTPASPTVVARASTSFPPPGISFSVSLANTTAGAMGAATAFRAYWGDGGVTDWQSSPVLEHAYATAGQYRARFQARNDAGQTSSSLEVFQAGGSPPVEPDLASTVLAPENQERTFFIAGIAITAIGSAFGAWRIYGRRRVYARELRALESEEFMSRTEPAIHDTRLSARRQRIHGLHASGRLDSGQVNLLQRRVDELARNARLNVLHQDYGFLPVGLAGLLEKCLIDGKLGPAERAALVAAMEREPDLSSSSKEKVRRLIEEWSRHDA
ncbi:MAG: PQQ-like beta-propeller repeat protein [Euryarchaeota archaeon]|nr:PQQ-like beta-propeller repeat protein [Euryarchaeota archaeon]